MVSFPLHEENTRTEVGEKFIFDSFACLFYLFLFFFDNDAERERERERERENRRRASQKWMGIRVPFDDRIFISFCSLVESRIIGRGEQ